MIHHDIPIASISTDALPVKTEPDGADVDELLEPDESPDDLDFTDTQVKFDMQERFEKEMNWAYGEKFTVLWKGHNRDAGYRDDRSTAETGLATYLAWWMDNNRRVVAAMMSRSNAEEGASRFAADECRGGEGIVEVFDDGE